MKTANKITIDDINALNKALSVGNIDTYSQKLINTLNRLNLTVQRFETCGALKVESWDDIEKSFWKCIRNYFG